MRSCAANRVGRPLPWVEDRADAGSLAIPSASLGAHFPKCACFSIGSVYSQEGTTTLPPVFLDQ